MKKRDLLKLLSATSLAPAVTGMFGSLAFAQKKAGILRVAMTVADIPLTTGQPSQGGEGIRFMGITMYDGLTRWDLSKADEASQIVPDLAESWSVSQADPRTWIFKLRKGVRFHDGSEFNADAVVWNFDKLLKKDAPQFDQAQAAQAAYYSASLSSWKKVDSWTVEITTKTADAVLPYNLANLFMSSPAHYAELGNSWEKFAQSPSGTGPWKMALLKPRERAELVRNDAYWDAKRIPKSERLVLLPMPDSNTRAAALLSGQVDWIEAPPPDIIPRLKKQGMVITTNVYPQIWPYQVSMLEDSPFKDIRVRKAANLAIDRDGLVQLLGGLAKPAKGTVDENHPWFGKPSFQVKYDPEQAKKLLAEAGYGPANPVKVKFMTSVSGSGQMLPLPMNEFIKDNFKKVGIEMEIEVLEWETLRHRRAVGAEGAENKGRQGMNHAWAYWDPDLGLINPVNSVNRAGVGYLNWGNFKDDKADELAKKAKAAFDMKEQNRLLAELHTRVVDQAMWIWVVHDLNARAMSPSVKGFVQAQSWMQDLTTVTVS